ncbi:hypothetical protein [Pedobacter sp.]|uniref:hypothetical protein n=1 Tax=Pedobacter sp. TaxID=1411316 RepID=UPI0031DFA940
MFVLTGHFEIGDYKFEAINEVQITRSIDEISGSAVIKMPSRFFIKHNNALKYTEEVITAGNSVKITIGYKDKLVKQEFVGFVDSIKTGDTIQINCIDGLWLLKRKDFKCNEQKTTLAKVLKKIVEGTGIELSDKVPKLNLEKFTRKQGNAMQALQSLKEQTGLSIFLNDEGKLYCGLQQLLKIGKIATYDLNYNIVKNDLQIRTKNDKKIKIVYSAKTKDNQKISVEAGDKDGELQEITQQTVVDVDTLRQMANNHLSKLKYDGYDGDLTSFLIPYAAPSMGAKIIDDKRPHRNGTYLIKKVVTTFGTSGARRKVSIGNKLSNEK